MTGSALAVKSMFLELEEQALQTKFIGADFVSLICASFSPSDR